LDIGAANSLLLRRLQGSRARKGKAIREKRRSSFFLTREEKKEISDSKEGKKRGPSKLSSRENNTD